MSSLYIVEVIEGDEKYSYEYSNIDHANKHYDSEKTATMYEYKNGIHHYIKSK